MPRKLQFAVFRALLILQKRFPDAVSGKQRCFVSFCFMKKKGEIQSPQSALGHTVSKNNAKK